MQEHHVDVVTTASRERALRSRFDAAAERLTSSLDKEQEPAADVLAGVGARVAKSRRRRARTQGAYIHGPVGRGKTWLVEVLLDSLAELSHPPAVLRLHAYESSRALHAAVARQAGQAGAVDRALSGLLDGQALLFIDELHAHDPGDAMLLARLVRAANDHHIPLLATSNYAPDDLLPNPLHHHLVLPFVKTLNEVCRVVVVDGPVDHRESGHGGGRPRWSSGRWATPGSPTQMARLGLAAPQPGDGVRLDLPRRAMQVAAASQKHVWLTFEQYCHELHGTEDALALADRFPTVVVTGVPPLSTASDDAQRRFADLIDVLWDRDIQLVLVAGQSRQATLDSSVRDGDRLRSRLSLLADA